MRQPLWDLGVPILLVYICSVLSDFSKVHSKKNQS